MKDVGEVVVQRDEKNRILGFVVRDINAETTGGASALYFLQAAANALTDYLHVPVEASVGDEAGVLIDRSDPHLDREIDAILETVVIGLRMLEREFPADLEVPEATAGVEV